MKDFELYQQILSLVEPWRVESVTLKTQEREIEVRVGFADTHWGCPQCQQRMQIHDYEERRWRHLDSCQFQTIIVSRVPSVRCPDHGSQTVAVPWAEKYARFTQLFERLAVEGLNNKIQGFIQKAFGYRNKERFKTDIFFHLGGLDLYPAQ